MTLLQKLLKRLPKKYHDRVKEIEAEADLVDDCKYMLYFSDDYIDDDYYGYCYPVRSINEAIKIIKDLYKVEKTNDMYESVLTDENKELLKLKKADIVKMIINKKYSSEELERFNKNDFAKFQLWEYGQQLMRESKGSLIFHHIQEGKFNCEV